MNQNVIEKNGLADRLTTALNKDEFLLFRQIIKPIGEKADQRPFQEILIRFQEEEAKLLPPGTFLPLLDENGLMPFVDRWVINRLTKWIGTVHAAKPDWKIPRNGINLSPQTLQIQSFPDFVRKHIDAGKLPEGSFCFELCWQDAVENAEALIRTVRQLKPVGCRFTIARFEGVPGSFELLKMFAPDYVKLSPRIIMNIAQNPASAAATQIIHSECSAVGIQTIAEYVESEEVMSELWRIGVHYVQGFHIKAPEPLTE